MLGVAGFFGRVLMSKAGPWITVGLVVAFAYLQHQMIQARNVKINELEAQIVLEQRNQRALAEECEARELALSEELARQTASRRRAERAREGARHVEGDTAGARAERVLDGLRGAADEN
jgi:uncharacterized protein (DUF39 family)